jgi:hypothetical protein
VRFKDPLNVAELGFFLLLAVIASKAVAVEMKDKSTRASAFCQPDPHCLASVARLPHTAR